MNINSSLESVNIVKKISESVETFHHHYHILFDIAKYFNESLINYVEIGTYGGGSASLMMHRPNTNILSIDIGRPIPKEKAISNVNGFNSNGNFYKYICGDSSSNDTINELKDTLKKLEDMGIDILFIDGDHSYDGVYKDFLNYNSLVKLGGFLVFDDYMDDKYSPQVKTAVDDIIQEYCVNNKMYEIIGCLHNKHKAHPNFLEYNNCFILRKIL